MTIRSMTGFGRVRREQDGVVVTFELSAVNNRFCQIQCSLPKSFNALESRLRGFLEGRIRRGKVNAWLGYMDLLQSPVTPSLDEPLLEQYIRIAERIREKAGIAEPLRIQDLMSFGDLIRKESSEPDFDLLWDRIIPVVEASVEEFNRMREEEGSRTVKFLLASLDALDSTHRDLAERAPFRLEEYQTRLRKRINDLAPEISHDPNRLVMEVALWADRVDIHEELDRFAGHLTAFRQVLEEGGEVGNKLNFLVQELQREATTAGNKSNDMSANKLALKLKEEIEKIREQIQNLE